MTLTFSRRCIGFVYASPDLLVVAYVKSALDGKPVFAYSNMRRGGHNRSFRPLGGRH